jgi:hypothetical protein
MIKRDPWNFEGATLTAGELLTAHSSGRRAMHDIQETDCQMARMCYGVLRRAFQEWPHAT